MTSQEESPRRSWLLSFLISALAAVVLGLPTGLTLLALLDSRNTTLWFLAFPLAIGALVLFALRHWRPLPSSSPSRRRRRALIVAGSIAAVVGLDAVVLVGGVKPRSECTWEKSPEVAANTDVAPSLSLTDDGKGQYS